MRRGTSCRAERNKGQNERAYLEWAKKRTERVILSIISKMDLADPSSAASRVCCRTLKMGGMRFWKAACSFVKVSHLAQTLDLRRQAKEVGCTISASSPASRNSASLPSALMLHTLTLRLSASLSVRVKSSRSCGIWFCACPPGWEGAMAIVSRSMKTVWRATSRCEAVGAEDICQSQGRSSGHTPCESSILARAETRRVEAARACELNGDSG